MRAVPTAISIISAARCPWPEGYTASELVKYCRLLPVPAGSFAPVRARIGSQMARPQLLAPLTHELAEAMPRWRDMVAPLPSSSPTPSVRR